jgi:flavin-dependent dehydrogenase
MQVKSPRVVIGGVGLSAGMLALRLRAFGFSVLLIDTGLRPYSAVESVPSAVLRGLWDLGLKECLSEAMTEKTSQFENRLGPDPVITGVEYAFVNRTRLAQSLLRRAIRSGAELRREKRLSQIMVGTTEVLFMEAPFDFAVDATGRSAVWSRPLCRSGREVVELYAVLGFRHAPHGAIVKTPNGWAYLLAKREEATLGVAGTPPSKDEVAYAVEAFHLTHGQLRLLGRRPSFPQWASSSLQGTRLSIGDAAVAFSPMAGSGIQFAFASALTAAAVIRTCQFQPDLRSTAEEHYRDFCFGAQRHHIRRLSEALSPPRVESIPSAVQFAAPVRWKGVHRDGWIVPERVYELPSGECVRWLGPVDLASMERAARSVTLSSDLVIKLYKNGLVRSAAQAQQLVEWCWRNGLLRDAAK